MFFVFKNWGLLGKFIFIRELREALIHSNPISETKGMRDCILCAIKTSIFKKQLWSKILDSISTVNMKKILWVEMTVNP